MLRKLTAALLLSALSLAGVALVAAGVAAGCRMGASCPLMADPAGHCPMSTGVRLSAVATCCAPVPAPPAAAPTLPALALALVAGAPVADAVPLLTAPPSAPSERPVPTLAAKRHHLGLYTLHAAFLI
ncbi:MAG TPA: hypothetical protein VF017_06650 [Thermoanaerobaculia bacterium]|nr:hypothetical protein [Thermoanaerobaculia bacterium]